MKFYRLEYQVEYPPANIVLVENSEPEPMTEDECREIIEPIIEKLTRLLKPEVIMKLVFGIRNEAKGDWQLIADFWREAEKKYLFP